MTALNAYIDESIRGARYLLCLVMVKPDQAGSMRRRLRSLVLPGQRTLHFKKESPRRRRELLVALGELDVAVTVYECAARPGRSQDASRALCLERAIADLQALGATVSVADREPQRSRRRGPGHDHQGTPVRSTAVVRARPTERRSVALATGLLRLAGGSTRGLATPSPAPRHRWDRQGGLKKPQTQPPTVRTSAGFTSSGPGPPAPSVCHHSASTTTP